jgi:hypothetical protein
MRASRSASVSRFGGEVSPLSICREKHLSGEENRLKGRTYREGDNDLSVDRGIKYKRTLISVGVKVVPSSKVGMLWHDG